MKSSLEPIYQTAQLRNTTSYNEAHALQYGYCLLYTSDAADEL